MGKKGEDPVHLLGPGILGKAVGVAKLPLGKKPCGSMERDKGGEGKERGLCAHEESRIAEMLLRKY